MYDTAYIDFSASTMRRARWAIPFKDIADFDDDSVIERLWYRCQPWVKVLRTSLMFKHGWRLVDDDGSVPWLFALEQPSSSSAPHNASFALPLRFCDFFKPELRGVWDMNFNTSTFRPAVVARGRKCDVSLHRDLPEPLVDMFYILQCVSPGMLLITCVDNRRGMNPHDRKVPPGSKYERGIPPVWWLETREDELRKCLGHMLYEHLLATSKIHGVACWI